MSGLRFGGHVAFGGGTIEPTARPRGNNELHMTARIVIDITDIDAFLIDSRHEAQASGWIECDALGGRLAVQSGVFRVFVIRGDPPQTQLFYRLWFRDAVGHPLTFIGFKALPGAATARVWHDTTVLYTRVLFGHVESESDSEPVVSGIIRIHVLDFLIQLTSFRGSADTPSTRARAVGRYIRFFAAHVWQLYEPRLQHNRGRPTGSSRSDTGSLTEL
jgi:hypothetical protein